MSKPKNTKPPYPAEFRQQIVELARAVRKPKELAAEFGRRAATIGEWLLPKLAACPRLYKQSHCLAMSGAN